jgi:HemX protein
MLTLLHAAAFGLYAIAAGLMAVSFAKGSRRLPSVASWVLGLGLVVHVVALADFAAQWDQLPLVGLGPSLSTLAFLIGLGSLMAATLGHAATVGLVLVPLVAFFTGVAVVVGPVPAAEPMAFQEAWFAIHVVFAFVGLAGLTVAFAAGLMYLLQFRELKSKHFGAIFRFFPPLDTLDRLGRQGLLVGFPFLTLALLLGWAWTTSFAGPPTPGNLKLAWVGVSWLVFLSALVARAGGGRKAERGALASVIGFVVVVVVYVIVRAQAAQIGTFL